MVSNCIRFHSGGFPHTHTQAHTNCGAIADSFHLKISHGLQRAFGMPETTQSMTNPAPRCQRKIESRQCSDKCQISSAEGPGLILVLVLNFIHKLILKCFLSTHMAAVALTGVVNGSGKYVST